MMIIKSVKLENWAKSQKRVTVGRIRKEFGVDEELEQQWENVRNAEHFHYENAIAHIARTAGRN